MLFMSFFLKDSLFKMDLIHIDDNLQKIADDLENLQESIAAAEMTVSNLDSDNLQSMLNVLKVSI